MAVKKAKYEAIVGFLDGEDNKKEYKVGDVYPNPVNKKISEERIQSLLSNENAEKKPVIKEI